MTFNTGNPIGSTDARDRSDNSENLDLAVNSLSPTFVDRLGVTRDTLEGIYQKSEYYRAGTFDAGYTLTNNRQTLAYGNVEYSWSGAFPKVVQAGSTPATSGGVGAGAWVDRTDDTLRDEIFGVKGYISKTYTISSLFPSLQDAMNYAATNNVILYVQAGVLFTDPVLVPSNLHCVFHKSTEIKANTGFTNYQTLLDFSGASNVIFETNGCLFWMPKSEYTSGEWRHCFNLKDASRVQILGAPRIEGAGGDGIYISNLTRSYIDRPFIDNSRRNNISIISCDGLTIYNPTCTNANGTSPQCGIDIEPNVSTEVLKNLRIVNPVCRSNAGYGISIYLDSFKTGSPDTVDIKIESPLTKSNGGFGINVKNVFNNTDSYSGIIEITDPVSIDDGFNGIQVYDKGENGPILKITNPTIINPCRNSAVYPKYSAVSIIDTSASPSGGIHITDIVAKCSDSNMNYALLLEYGQGITSTSATVKSSSGHSISTIRHGGLGSTNTIALASTVDIHCDNSRQEEARTASDNLTDTRYYALTLTNEGATEQVTLRANQIPPKGVPYRFRCLSPQSFRVGLTNDTTAKIIGTSAVGMTVSTTTVGAEGELYYFGSISGVDYWQFRPIGASSLWVFN